MTEESSVFSWQPMTAENFAAVVGLLSPGITRVGEMYWSEVRRCFYRPLLPLKVYSPEAIRIPWTARLGGVQYAVGPDEPANSFLNWLAFDPIKKYSLADLDRDRRRQVRLASREFTLRVLSNLDEFKQQAYPVYLSFYERTRYNVGAHRRDQGHFATWAHTLFQIPNLLILGAYRQGELGGVSISYLREQTVFYATFFCDDASMGRHLPGLMLHAICSSAAASPNATHVFVGSYKGLRGLDDFYLQRGAKLIRQPARLELNPAARFILKNFLPTQYERLLGHLTDEQLAQAGVHQSNSG